MPESRSAAAERMRKKRAAEKEAQALLAKAAEDLEEKLSGHESKPGLHLVPTRPTDYVPTTEDRQAKFFERLEYNFSPIWAQAQVGVTEEEFLRWAAADPRGWDARMNRAKHIFAGNLQAKAVEANSDKNPLLLMELLKAIDPKYGRSRLEDIKRATIKVVKVMHKLLNQELGKNHSAQIESIVKRMDAEVAKIAQPYAK